MARTRVTKRRRRVFGNTRVGITKEFEVGLSELMQALYKFGNEEVEKASKEALRKATEPIYQDMLKEFTVNHPGTGATAKDLKKGEPKAKGEGGYGATVQYLRRGTTGRGFVALFFNYGVPHMKSAKSKASIGFIQRAFGIEDNPERAKEIKAILTEEIQKAIQRSMAGVGG